MAARTRSQSFIFVPPTNNEDVLSSDGDMFKVETTTCSDEIKVEYDEENLNINENSLLLVDFTDSEREDESEDEEKIKNKNPSVSSKYWTCPICKKVLINARSRWRHLRSHKGKSTKTIEPTYTCQDCSCTFETLTACNLHRTMKHNKDRVALICPECAESFQTKKLLSQHVKLHTAAAAAAKRSSGMDLECLMCFKKFASRITLSKHYILRHGNNEEKNDRFHCPFLECTKNYAGNDSLRVHILVHHLKTKLHKCSVCQKGFSRKDNLMKHMKSCHKDVKDVNSTQESDEDSSSSSSFQSDVCVNKRIQQKSPFVVEKKCSHNRPSLQLDKRSPGFCDECRIFCRECSYSFVSTKNFSAHTHENFCKKCCIKFRKGKFYSHHLKYHLNDENVAGKCQDCLFGFESDMEMRNHLRIWHGKISLTCPVCKKTYKSRNCLNVHKQSHKERKWICKECSKPFQTCTQLKKHHLALHPEIVWKGMEIPLTPTKNTEGNEKHCEKMKRKINRKLELSQKKVKVTRQERRRAL